MAGQLPDVLLRLSEGGEYLERFRADPKGVLNETELSDDEKGVLLAGDVNGIRSAVQENAGLFPTVTIIIVAVVIISH